VLPRAAPAAAQAWLARPQGATQNQARQQETASQLQSEVEEAEVQAWAELAAQWRAVLEVGPWHRKQEAPCWLKNQQNSKVAGERQAALRCHTARGPGQQPKTHVCHQLRNRRVNNETRKPHLLRPAAVLGGTCAEAWTWQVHAP